MTGCSGTTTTSKILRSVAMACCAPILAACVTAQTTTGPAADVTLAPDPFEPFNRAMLKVNTGVEKGLIKPIDIVYRAVAPKPLQQGLSNAAYNLTEPVNFANELLQLKPARAGKTLARFLINSTVGLGGLLDLATRSGIPRHAEDFGQTLGVWGLGNGPYLVLPLLGPTTVRDGIGTGVDTYTDPTYWLIDDSTTSYALWGGRQFIDYDDHRDELEELRKSSLDFYSALRSSYLQQRRSDVYDGHPPPAALPDILDQVPEQPRGDAAARQDRQTSP
jgi:phospholipid-binding lipoprotein MlaA